MTVEAKIMRLADMAHRDGSLDLIAAYAASILEVASAAGSLPQINRSIAHDLRGLVDVVLCHSVEVAGQIEAILKLTYPIE